MGKPCLLNTVRAIHQTQRVRPVFFFCFVLFCVCFCFFFYTSVTHVLRLFCLNFASNRVLSKTSGNSEVNVMEGSASVSVRQDYQTLSGKGARGPPPNSQPSLLGESRPDTRKRRKSSLRFGSVDQNIRDQL